MFTEYITIQGDRWDSIALKAFGDATIFSKIQDANPNIPLSEIFEGGIKLLIPIIEIKENTNVDLLPPWKRNKLALQKTQEEIITNLQNSVSNGKSFDGSFD